MKLLMLLCCSAIACLSAQASTLTFTKSFPGSQPPYVSVSIAKTGALEYKESPTDTQPVKAQLPEKDTAPLFEMAEKLNYFHDPLESGLKVAKTGEKTFRYTDDAGKKSETVFNYSTNVTAQQLLNKLENIAATERTYIELERTIRFDKLGVNDALAQVESLWLRKELAAPLQFVPLLNRVAAHESFMHLARERAGRLRDQFQAPPIPAAEPNAGAK